MKRSLFLVLVFMVVAALLVPTVSASNATYHPQDCGGVTSNSMGAASCAPCDPTDPTGGCYVPPPCDPTDPTGGCYVPPPCDPTDPTGGCYVPPPCGSTSMHTNGGNPCDPCNTVTVNSVVSAQPDQCPQEPTNPVTPVVPVVNGRGDDGISFNDADLGVVLYQTTDANGNASLDVYDMKNAGTNGAFMFSVTQEDLAPFVNNPPAENTLLKQGGHVAIYVLSTGEIQMNVGPDSEGKIFVKIFDGIPWTHVTSYTIDPE